ncbi:bifunctional folylpolyglutamate synthase/dihydrofolate synthase [Enterococcus timonensis]|uniref:bifunctional folylpolyglutamate synthase/dihydrofolate synthase n=1 Tax=Enterococcus timonensis TaxID=1852364 RepID=UPI0008D9A54C|nr:folylpolyglutamate synthase/dihydrofolate synthase family protein [Enterococcus timonensis]
MSSIEKITNVKEAIDWLHGRLKFGLRPGLLRIETLLDRLGNPEADQKFIHIAGTNGKGSTVKFLANMLEETGLTVGTFTSPFIIRFNERIQINGEFISDEELLFLIQKILPFVAEMDQDEELKGLTEFEINTVLGFLYFQDKVDVAVIEVGLGGLLDSTNVLTPTLTGITTIGYDHMDILGNTLPEIATQKAGIIKQNIPVVTGNIVPEALNTIKEIAKNHHSQVIAFAKDYQVTFEKDELQGERLGFSMDDWQISHIHIPLIGRHQVENAGMAMALFITYCQKEQIHFAARDIQNGLMKTVWPARMEVLQEDPLILLDGAHNDHAVKRLVENIKVRFKNREIWLLYSSIVTKDIDLMLLDLKKIPHSHLLVTTFDYPKAMSLDDLKNLAAKGFDVRENWAGALREILQQMDENDVVIICGSLYFSSQVREIFVGGLHD